MVQGVCRIWNISIVAVIFLSIYNTLLTLKLMYKPECIQSPNIVNNIVRYTAKPPPALKCETNNIKINNVNDLNNFTLNLKLGRWDTKHDYKLFDNIFIGTKFTTLSEAYSTCLATQSSLERISSLPEVATYWNGPISVALFAAGDEELNLLLLYILYLRKCKIKIREQVNFHMAIPKSHYPQTLRIDYDRLALMDCFSPYAAFQSIIQDFKKTAESWRKNLPYPQNHLRNLARKNCQSNFVFLTDVDIVPMRGMARKLDTFLAKASCEGKCAYVVPTYEIDERVMYPQNKTEVVRLRRKGLARPFHQKVFIYNQFATNFTRWESFTDDGTEVHVSHPVTNFEFLYEPFYIAPDAVPPHDERFVGYGYTRNTQVYEMYVAGYRFYVLSPIFTYHWGLQGKKTRPNWREMQNNMNRKLFEGFKKEIFAKYDTDPLNMIKKKNH